MDIPPLGYIRHILAVTTNKHGLRGVNYDKKKRKFQGAASLKGKIYRSKWLQTAEEAALAYDDITSKIRDGPVPKNYPLNGEMKIEAISNDKNPLFCRRGHDLTGPGVRGPNGQCKACWRLHSAAFNSRKKEGRMSHLKHQHQAEFEKTTIATVGARPIGAFLIRCGKCSNTDKISLQNNIPIPPDRAARRFEAKGWDTSKGRRDRDVCPRCTKITPLREVETMKAPATNVVALSPIQAAEIPEPMTREDKRVVFAKINEVYIDEKVGYGPGWTDARVATDLGVPRAWVTKVRDEDFGPEAANEEIRGLLAQAKSCAEETRRYLETFASLSQKQEDIWKSIKGMEGAATGLGTQCERIEKHLLRIQKQLGG